MNFKTATLIIAVFVFALVACGFEPALAGSGGSWVGKAPMSQARAYLGTAVVSGKIYAIGGDEGSEIGNCMTGTSMTNNVVNYTEEYDPALNQWISKASMPTPRALFGTAVYQNKIYCIGGYSGAVVRTGPEDWEWSTKYSSLNITEVYNPASDSWTTAAPMPTARNGAATNIVGNKIYVIGGHTMSDLYVTYNTTEVYDTATDSWTTKTSAPLPVSSPASAVIDGKIYVLGEDPQKNWQNTLEIYEPSTDTWTIKNVTPISHSAAAAATTGTNALKRIYFFDENKTDIYDPYSNSWSAGAQAPTDRLIAKAAVVDDTIYLIGGRTGQWGYMTFMYPSKLNEQYRPLGYGTPDKTTPQPSQTLAPTATPIENLTGNPALSDEQTHSVDGQPHFSVQLVPLAVIAVSVIVSATVLYAMKRQNNVDKK